MLFLGAGASKPLGLPTMEEFTETILKDIESGKLNLSDEVVRRCVPKIREIQANISSTGQKPDIEAILAVLQARAKPKKALQEIGLLVTAFSQDYQSLTEEEEIQSFVVLSEIEEAIRPGPDKVAYLVVVVHILGADTRERQVVVGEEPRLPWLFHSVR